MVGEVVLEKRPRAASSNVGESRERVFDIVIVGAGFSGLGMAKKLQDRGFHDFIILEAAHEVGGTWRDSRYPGAAVDVPNHLYSYSFEPYGEWSRMFSPWKEIQEYIIKVSYKYNLRPKIRFHSRVVEMIFDSKRNLWRLTLQNGQVVEGRFVIMAIGPFAEPRIPDIPGLQDFEGKMTHTSNYDDSLVLHGKTVALVGSAASAIQVGPAIQPIVKHLYIFQRTPAWVIPKLDYVYSDLEKSIYRNFPILQKIRRYWIFAITELLATAIVWDTPMTDFLEWVVKKRIEENIPDPEMRKLVTPNYRLGKTRMLISNDWYPTLVKPNVTLVPHGVERLTPRGPVAAGKEYPVEVIIWATGYKSPAEGFPFLVKGLDGRDLNSYWEKGARAFKGVAIAGFPNLFTLMGPNTGPGHTSVLVYVEAQHEYILQALELAKKRSYRRIVVRQEREDQYNEELAKKMSKTTWGSGGKSWYYTKDGRNTTLYPGFATEYVLSVLNFNPGDYILS
ncbi:MAG: NAD(P)/FAD-dependent oxidoreductase [Leptospiraceae bacterium]|nr:NAD(P)/FAD-dependent oxidoreductase [Leptospiraceae bacterium]MDW8306987.1 NAD(P)/FAD-dependent oxidoreductase [Leptospiraceae bacterium]